MIVVPRYSNVCGSQMVPGGLCQVIYLRATNCYLLSNIRNMVFKVKLFLVKNVHPVRLM